jgi:hypothetical protein
LNSVLVLVWLLRAGDFPLTRAETVFAFAILFWGVLTGTSSAFCISFSGILESTLKKNKKIWLVFVKVSYTN